MPIKDTDKKLEEFTGAIISDAIEDSNKIVLELRDKQIKLISKADTDIAAEAIRYQNVKIAEIKTRENLRVNARMTENKFALLQYREEWANKAFIEVRDKVVEFTTSQEYLPHLESLLKKAIEFLGYGHLVEVSLRHEDMHFADDLIGSVTGVSIAVTEGSFSLGGLRVVCPSKGQRIDLSFDTSLNDMVGHFSELADLKMDD